MPENARSELLEMASGQRRRKLLQLIRPQAMAISLKIQMILEMLTFRGTARQKLIYAGVLKWVDD